MMPRNILAEDMKNWIRDGFGSDEELSLDDLLLTDSLSKTDIEKIKGVAVCLLQTIKSKIAELDRWIDKQDTKAVVENLIRDTLWEELRECYVRLVF